MPRKADGGVSYITAWFHASASVGAERQTMVRQVAEFNHSQRLVHVQLITLPEGDYGREVATAAASGTLPDVLDFDGPNLYNYAWAGDLKPIDSCLTAAPARGPAAVDPPAGDLRRSNVGRRDVRLGTWAVCAAIDPAQGRDLDPDGCVPGMDRRAVHSRSWRVYERSAIGSRSTFRSTTTARRRSGTRTVLPPPCGRPGAT